MSDLQPLQTYAGRAEMVDVLREGLREDTLRVRVTRVDTGLHRFEEWTRERVQQFANDVAAGVR